MKLFKKAIMAAMCIATISLSSCMKEAMQCSKGHSDKSSRTLVCTDNGGNIIKKKVFISQYAMCAYMEKHADDLCDF